MIHALKNKTPPICLSAILLLSYCGEPPAKRQGSIQSERNEGLSSESLRLQSPAVPDKTSDELTLPLFKWHNLLVAHTRSVIDTSRPGDPEWISTDNAQTASLRGLFSGKGQVFQSGNYLIKLRSDDGSVAVLKATSPLVFINVLQKSQKIGRSLDVKMDSSGKVLLQLVLDPKAPSYVRILDYPLDEKVQPQCPETQTTLELIKDLGTENGPCLIYFPKLVGDARILGDLVLGIDRAQTVVGAIDIRNLRKPVSATSLPCIGTTTRQGACQTASKIDAFFSSSEDGTIGLMTRYSPIGFLKLDLKQQLTFEPVYLQTPN